MTSNEETLRDLRISLRARNLSEATIKAYVARGVQFAEFLGGRDLLTATRRDVEQFVGKVLADREPSTAVSYFRHLQALYKWAAEEDLIEVSPVQGLRPPQAPVKPVDVVTDEQIQALLKTCKGKMLVDLRDEALVRLALEPGGLRRTELADRSVDDVDLDTLTITVVGKGSRVRQVGFGFRTAKSLTRYLRARSKVCSPDVTALWVSASGRPLTGSGVAQMLERRCQQAGIPHIHPHKLRHTSAHRWFDADGGETNAMQLFGWRDRAMLGRYAASTAAERARAAARRLALGDQL